MFLLVLLLLLFMTACDRAPDAAPVFVDGIEHAPLLTCTERSSLGMPGTATELSRVGDTAIVALFADARTVMLLDETLRELRRVELAREGPRGVTDPASVIAEGDSIYIADAKAGRIVIVDWAGTRRAVIDTDFSPVQLARLPHEIAVAPAIIGRFPGTLLYGLHGDTVVRRSVAVVDFPDLATKGLANRVKMLALGDGLLMIHQFFTPRALYLAGSRQQALRVPLPAAAKSALGYVPPLPLNDEGLRPALVIASDAAVAERNEVLMLVRTGRAAGDRFEKAIMRTDSTLNYLSAFRLPMNAGLLAYVPRTRTAILVDDEDRWFTCVLPS